MACKCGGKKTAADANEEKVLDALKKARKPIEADEVAKMAKLDKDVVTKLITKLKRDGKVISPERCKYALA